ncbi:MAG: phosphoenolpyruvate carboxylase [Elusimicrobiota bacterium]
MPQKPAVPRCMSTQHPDNAHVPYFGDGAAIGGEGEVQEAYHAFSRFGCDEQMWDHEGKEVDAFVVSKLLAAQPSYFRKKRLGRDVFLTLRVPNPSRERGMAKVLLEVLESIPRSFDIARAFYKKDVAPIFEIILPMTTNAVEVSRIWHYYREFVSGKADRQVIPGDVTLREWIGDFKPESIRVIPLIEDKDSMLRADTIVEEYMRGKPLDHQRVFLARSDPAMTYGSASAVLLLKIALSRLHQLEARAGIPIYPIVGLGTAPFRGNFKPTSINTRLKGYPSVQTFTIQSAFKFDYPEELVRNAIRQLKAARRRAPIPVEDEPRVLELVEKMAACYAGQVAPLAPLINDVARFVPSRRKRRLHVGLFGYARSVSGVHLPRAIGFCASLYSLGVPPELLGLEALSRRDIPFILENYPNFRQDMADALQYFDPQSLDLLPPRVAADIKRTLRLLRLDVEPNLIHQSLVRAIRKCLGKNFDRTVSELIEQAGRERKFLG